MEWRILGTLEVAMPAPARAAQQKDATGTSSFLGTEVMHDLGGGVLRSLLATGIAPQEGMAHVVDCVGLADAHAAWLDALGWGLPGEALMALLDGVADRDGTCADAWLNEALSRGRIPEWGDGGHGASIKDMPGYHFEDRQWLTHLPEGFQVEGSLDVRGCTALFSLPQGLLVGGSGCFAYCTALESVSSGTSFGGAVAFNGCTSLRHLPCGLKAGKFLDFTDCHALQSIPEGMQAGTDLRLERCRSLEWIGEGVLVGGGMDLTDCAKLERMPANLHLQYLFMDGCQHLTSLPSGLRIEGDLFAAGCLAWDRHIPDDAFIGGRVLTAPHG